MGLTKSLPQNLRRSDGNGLTLFIFDQTNELYLTDIYGNIQPLSDYINIPTQSSVDNLGTGAQVYKTGSSNPFDFRSLKQGSNVTITQNADEIEIAVPTISGVPLYRGAFFSTQTQNSAGNEQKLVTYNNTDIGGHRVVLQNQSEIRIQNAGDYNIQHSIQLVRTQGGGSSQFYLWLVKNGNPVANTNTKISFGNNNTFQVASWNFFVTAAANDVFQLGWYATSEYIELHYDAAPVAGLPAIPSVILTVNRIG